MLRRQARLRREYVYRKAIEQRERTIQEKKQKIKHALDQNEDIPTHLRGDAVAISKTLDWDDDGGKGIATHMDDEYRWAGVTDPKIMLTTSHDPSSRLKMFAKEFRLIMPNAQRINRGNYEMKQLISACRSNGVTDLVMLSENRGTPDGIIICHLPHGPTAYFSLTNVIMRHDIQTIGTMSEEYPHLIFHNLSSKLGQRVTNILKYLFPVPKEESHRVITFANQDDYISFRHHTYKKVEKQVVLAEVGPRFELKLYKIIQGTLEVANSAEIEWTYRPYMNTTKKRKFLGD